MIHQSPKSVLRETASATSLGTIRFLAFKRYGRIDGMKMISALKFQS
jgi:hypothetical protein